MLALTVLYRLPCSMCGRISTAQFGPKFWLKSAGFDTPEYMRTDGGSAPFVSWYPWHAMPICLRLLLQLIRAAA